MVNNVYELLMCGVDGIGMSDFSLFTNYNIGFGRDELFIASDFGVDVELGVDFVNGGYRYGGGGKVGIYSFYNLYLVDVVGAEIKLWDYYLDVDGNCCFNGILGDDIDFDGCRRIIAKSGFKLSGIYGISEDFLRKYIVYYNKGVSINYVCINKDEDGIILDGKSNVIIFDNGLYNKGLYDNKDVRALFEKFINDRSSYYAEDADDIVPLDKWLDDNLLNF